MRSARTLLSVFLGLLMLAVPAASAAHVHAHRGAPSVNGECSLCALSHAPAEGDLAPPPQALRVATGAIPFPQGERAPLIDLATGPAVRGPPSVLL